MAKPRILAPVSLILAAALFFATLPFTDMFVFGLLHAFGEAAMIGGLADWFAVVALFRHPMGIPIPHTAILPAHREKLTIGIVSILENNWLNKQSILERITDWQIVPAVLDYLGTAAKRKPVLEMLKSVALNVIRSGDTDVVADRVSAALQHELTEERLLRGLQKAGGYAVESGLAGQLLPPVFDSARKWCGTAEAQEAVTELAKQAAEKYAASPLKQLGKTVLEFTRVVDYSKLSTAILSAVEKELENARNDEDHLVRKSVLKAISEYVSNLESDEEARAAAGRFRDSLSHEGQAPDWLRELVNDGLDALASDLEKDDPALLSYLDQVLEAAVERIAANPDAIGAADAWIKSKIGEIVESYHGEIGKLVRDNLSNLADDEMVRQIESRVGDDLQFIRLNGAIVGGMVGAIIFLLKHYLM